MLGEQYVVMMVECPRCKTKQKVHVAARSGPTLMADGRIQSIQCLAADARRRHAEDRRSACPFVSYVIYISV